MVKLGAFMFLFALLYLCSPAFGAVVAPWVTTDRSVDTSSLKSIVSSLTRPDMTEEGKAIALTITPVG